MLDVIILISQSKKIHHEKKRRERDFDYMHFYVPYGLISPILIDLKIYAQKTLNNMMT